MDSAASQPALGFEIERAEPTQRADSSSVLRPNVPTTHDTERAAAERREAPPAGGLPCLNSNNSDGEPAKQGQLQGMARKVAFSLTENVKAVAKDFGVERLGFLTFTFPDHVTDPKECNRRFDNLRRRALSRYEKWIAVRDRQASGRLHLHLLVVLGHDIKTGVDFAEIRKRNYRSAGPYLRAEWAFWRNAAEKYGFGRTELMPIKSTAEGIARYVGKYIQKNLDCRTAADKGARLVSYSKGAGPVKANGFGWNSPRAWLWRNKLGQAAAKCGITHSDELKETFGSRWAWTVQKRVISEKLNAYPTGEIARCNDVCVPSDVTDVRIKRSGKDVSYWEDNLDEWILEAQKALSFAALKTEREFFTVDREAAFQRKAAESADEASKYPQAVVENRISQFDEVVVSFPAPALIETYCEGPF